MDGCELVAVTEDHSFPNKINETDDVHILNTYIHTYIHTYIEGRYSAAQVEGGYDFVRLRGAPGGHLDPRPRAIHRQG